MFLKYLIIISLEWLDGVVYQQGHHGGGVGSVYLLGVSDQLILWRLWSPLLSHPRKKKNVANFQREGLCAAFRDPVWVRHICVTARRLLTGCSFRPWKQIWNLDSEKSRSWNFSRLIKSEPFIKKWNQSWRMKEICSDCRSSARSLFSSQTLFLPLWNEEDDPVSDELQKNNRLNDWQK